LLRRGAERSVDAYTKLPPFGGRDELVEFVGPIAVRFDVHLEYFSVHSRDGERMPLKSRDCRNLHQAVLSRRKGPVFVIAALNGYEDC
jgi:hypothetical protein